MYDNIKTQMYQPLFVRGPSPLLRLVLFGSISLALMMVDYRLAYLDQIRAQLSLIVYPIQYIVDLPIKTGKLLSDSLHSHVKLLEQRNNLSRENHELKLQLLTYKDLKNENERLRELLNSARKLETQSLGADILSVKVDSFRRKLAINKGSYHGVFKGQAVVDANGVLGQIEHVNFMSSIVLLITDPYHALPVEISRTGERSIAEGLGVVGRVALLYLANNADIQVGDELVTSGLDGLFPRGYPVARISEINPDIGQSYAQVQAVPYARFERNREVLLIWPDREIPDFTASSTE
jgi:rod shape-determining protein MreC